MEGEGEEPPEPDQNVQVAEYEVLERRTHNDSRIAYAVYTACLASSTAFFSVAVIAALEYGIEMPNPFYLGLLVIPSLFLLFYGRRVLEQFNSAGDVRIARCVQLEREIDIHSFRLFPPWREWPPEYLFTLGQWIARSRGDEEDAQQRQYFENIGIESFRRFEGRTRVTGYVNQSWWMMVILWLIYVSSVIIWWVASGTP